MVDQKSKIKLEQLSDSRDNKFKVINLSVIA